MCIRDRDNIGITEGAMPDTEIPDNQNQEQSPGGFFADSIGVTPVVDTEAREPLPPEQTADASTPGGFFDDGSAPVANRSASGHSNDALGYAEDARGWAVGNTTEGISD